MKYESSTPLDYRGNSQHIVKVNINGEDKEYYVVSERCESKTRYGEPFNHLDMYQKVWTYELLEFVKVKVKTKEQIAAEESVSKAKEALIAAENALKAVKESK
jgi:hypothetical protein